MSKAVTVYTSNGWGPCHLVKEFLSQRGVAFTERNVSNDPEARQSLKDLGFAATPVTVVGDEKIIGYNKRKIEAALAG